MKIWGLHYNEIYAGEELYWDLQIRNPFQMSDHKYRIGINEKLLKEAQRQGVKKLMFRGILFDVPSEKILKQKVKNKSFEDIPSKFAGSPAMRIFHFIIN